jgi:signal peptidase I
MRRTLLAVLANAVLPGAGEFVLGRLRRGIVFAAIFLCLVATSFIFRSASSFWFFVFVWWTGVLLSAIAVVSASWRLQRRLVGIAVALSCLAVAVVSVWAWHWLLFGTLRGYRTFNIPSESMEPTVLKGEMVMTHCGSSRPLRGTLIIYSDGSQFWLRRVIALEGDTIEILNDNVILNGAVVDEDFAVYDENRAFRKGFGPETVPAGRMFLMGDRRDLSLDSRYPEIGFVPMNTVQCKPLYILNSADDDRLGMRLD